jgi:hypothetical protein
VPPSSQSSWAHTLWERRSHNSPCWTIWRSQATSVGERRIVRLRGVPFPCTALPWRSLLPAHQGHALPWPLTFVAHCAWSSPESPEAGAPRTKPATCLPEF